MKLALLGLVALSVAVCSADLLSFREQGSGISGVRSETLVLVDDSQAGDPRFVSMVQQYDLNSVEDSSRQSFTVWPSTTAFIDGGWQTWVEQQLSMFDSLQGLLIPRCPHAAAQAAPPQSDYPSLLSYMASSRFGPSITAYARQVDQDPQPGAFSIAVDGEEAAAQDAEAEYEEPQSVWADSWQGSTSADERVRSLGDFSWFGQQHDAQVAGQLDSDDSLRQPLFRSTSASQQAAIDWDGKAEVEESELEEGIAWGDACNFALFVILCIGCVAVWAGLVRAWISCCQIEKQVNATKRPSSQAFDTNPLLTPLIPEGATSNPAHGDLEIASEHRTEGTYYAPQGSKYVSIAYVPLHSEANAHT